MENTETGGRALLPDVLYWRNKGWQPTDGPPEEPDLLHDPQTPEQTNVNLESQPVDAPPSAVPPPAEEPAAQPTDEAAPKKSTSKSRSKSADDSEEQVNG